MAKVMTPEQFRQCPQGTVFGFGAEWYFGNLLILHDFVEPFGNGGWGFYAVDPIWVQSNDSSEAYGRLEEMRSDGVSYPSQDSSTKYMNYDGDKMELFFVLEKPDWDAMRVVVENSFAKLKEGGQGDGDPVDCACCGVKKTIRLHGDFARWCDDCREDYRRWKRNKSQKEGET